MLRDKILFRELLFPSEDVFFFITFERKTVLDLEKSSPRNFPALGVIFAANRKIYSYAKILNF